MAEDYIEVSFSGVEGEVIVLTMLRSVADRLSHELTNDYPFAQFNTQDKHYTVRTNTIQAIIYERA